MDVANLKYLLVGSLIVSGCGDKTTDPEENNATSTNNSTTPTPQPQRWTTGLVEGGNVGLHPRIAVAPNGTIGAAWMAIEGREDGPCTELGEDPPPPMQIRWAVRYAEFNGTGWSAEDVADLRFVGQPPGIDLAFDANSTAILGGMAGDPVVQFRYCGVNDAAIYTRTSAGNWTAQTAVRNSGEAATGDAASDFGAVVGYWPALAVASNGDVGLAYKDVHAGGIQSDDFRRADLEFAWRRGNAWTPYPVDFGRGGGQFSKMVFDQEDRPIIMHYNPSEDNTGTLAGVGCTAQQMALSGIACRFTTNPLWRVQLWLSTPPMAPCGQRSTTHSWDILWSAI